MKMTGQISHAILTAQIMHMLKISFKFSIFIYTSILWEIFCDFCSEKLFVTIFFFSKKKKHTDVVKRSIYAFL